MTNAADAIRAAVYKVRETQNIVIELDDLSTVLVFVGDDGGVSINVICANGFSNIVHGSKLVEGVSDRNVFLTIYSEGGESKMFIGIEDIRVIRVNRPGNREQILYTRG